MAWETRNDCVDCDVCYGYCTKHGNYQAAICDKCGIDSDEIYEDTDGRMYCRECMLDRYRDIIPFVVCQCGTEVEESYQGLCEDCFLIGCDKVETR